MNIQAPNQVNQSQVNSNSLTTRANPVTKQVASALNTVAPQSSKDIVEISAQARTLSAQPLTPERPALGQLAGVNNKVQQYIDIQKSLAKADAIDNFTDDNFSVGEAYLAKNNDTVRNAYLAKDKIEQTNDIADIMIDSINQDNDNEKDPYSQL